MKILYGERKLLTGNYVAALGAALSRTKVIPGYPITPQTEIIEKLSEMCDDGTIDAKFISVESEHSAMMACIGAAPYARTFTATSSHGLKYMSEAIHSAANLRLPIVMVNVSRGMGLPFHLWCDHIDIITERDQGWGIFFAETNQEILDSTIIAFYLAEKTRIPIIVNIDGFISSHTAEPVIIPTQEQVDQFLPPYKPEKVDFKNPKNSYVVRLKAALYYDMKRKQFEAMKDFALKIPEAYERFAKIFGRSYGNGLIEKYGKYAPESSETVIVSYASHFGAVREAVDELQKKFSVSALKIRTLRPFPQESIAKNLCNADNIIVIDRNFSCGESGVFAQEIRATLQKNGINTPVNNAIAGLGGENITAKMIINGEYSKHELTTWLRNKKEKEAVDAIQNTDGKIIKTNFNSPYLPTNTACAGCGAAAQLNQVLKELGEKTHLIIPACCHSITTGCETGSNDRYEVSIFGKKINVKKGTHTAINLEHTLFAGAPATASGKLASFEQIGHKDIPVACWCGDGSTYDIGLQALSAACERGEPMLYICYNNQAYMNTGVQRSSATPLGANTNTSQTGKKQIPKNMMRIIAAHKIPYAATLILDKKHMGDFIKKIKKAKEIIKKRRGLVYLELFTPCPPGWGCDPSLTEELSRLAFETKIWPLYEIENGKIYKIKKPKELNEEEQLELIEQYIKQQGRFKGFSDEDIKNMQNRVNENWEELLKLEWLSGKTLKDLEKICKCATKSCNHC